MGLTPNAGTHTSRGIIPPRQEFSSFAVWEYVARCMRQGTVLASCTPQFMHGQLRACLRIGYNLVTP